MCHAAVFVNAVYRKCPIQNLKFDDIYDADFHVYNPTLKVSSIGFIGLYGVSETSTDDNLLASATKISAKIDDDSDSSSGDDSSSDSDSSSSSNDTSSNNDTSSSNDTSSTESPYTIPMDFGYADSDEMEAMLMDVELGRVFARYHPISHRFEDYDENPFVGLQQYEREPFSPKFEEKKQREAIDEFKHWAKQEGRFYVGVLPFKTMRMDILQVKRDKDFAEKARKELSAFMKVLNELRCLPYREKIRRFNEIYKKRSTYHGFASESEPKPASHRAPKQAPAATSEADLMKLFDID
jgi:hypothetical protein